MIESEKFMRLDKFLCENNIGNKYLTPNKNTKILLKNHQIYIIKQS